jgi:histidyl-tRNA synthetase
LKIIQDLRSAGLAVEYSLTPAKSDKQFKRAQELKAAQILKLERNPSGEIIARIKSLLTRQEQTTSLEEAVGQLRKTNQG